jgi:hypothetical protein
VVAPTGGDAVILSQTLLPVSATWNENSYFVHSGGGGFERNSSELSFSMWQNATGFDSNSTCQVRTLSGTKIFVRPNRYVAGRANIIGYNWSRQGFISVDVSQILPLNASYEVRNAQDFFGEPVASGIYSGQPLLLPMHGLRVSPPNGRMVTPRPTGPVFNVFVLIPRVVSLQIKVTNDQLQLTWPTNSGEWILQTAASLKEGAWRDVTQAPNLIGGQNVLTNAFSDETRFYRLRLAT